MTSSTNASGIAAFCKDLRDARRFQQISLPDVAEITRITPEYLEALEDGRWNEIPPAYLRGYLGLYAQAVGMNREKVLRSFDQMTIPDSAQNKAVFDEGPKILEEPQHAELTRVKIRTTWFASLSRNHAAVYGLTFLMIGVILGLIHISRRSQSVKVETVSFAQAQSEYKAQVHSPLTFVPLQTNSLESVLRSDQHWITCVGLRAGTVVFARDSLASSIYHFESHDTINIEYIHDIVLKIFPSQSACCRLQDSILVSKRVLPGDTQVFRLSSITMKNPEKTDSL